MQHDAEQPRLPATTSKRRRFTRAGTTTVPRDRILQVAARLFHERGYKATTVRDIASEVGILSGSLFHHFRTKEEMLLEIMKDAALSICLRAEAIVEQDNPAEEHLRELIKLEFDSITKESRRHLHGVLFLEWREVPEEAKPEFWRLRKRYQGTWLEVLRRCQEAGRLRCDEHAASLILHGALRNALTWYSPNGRYTPEQFGDILARLVLT